MKENVEEKLLSLVSKETTQTESTNQITPTRTLVEVDEIEDFIDKKADKPLSETDYLILTDYSKATPENIICENYQIKSSYLQKLLRNSNALDFLKKYKSNTEMQMMIRGNSVMSRVWEKKLAHIDKLLEEGKDSNAFYEMFGKLSFVEAQEKLTKMNQGEVEDKSAPLQNFFFNLQGRE